MLFFFYVHITCLTFRVTVGNLKYCNMSEEKAAEDDLQSKIVEFMRKHANVVPNNELQQSMTSVMSKIEYVSTLNDLITQHKVQLLQKGGQIVYKLKDTSSVKKYQDTDIEEKVIFEAVQRAGSNGVTARDVKNQCQLALARVNKILKSLESKKLVKCITSTSKKKIFLLYDLTPSQSVTGGIFYSGQEFDAEFSSVLGDQCYRYLVQAKAVADKLPDPISQRNASYKSSKDICDYINGLKISKDVLEVKDIEKVLESLIYDDKIEKFVSASKTYSSKDSGIENLYRVTKPLIKNGGYMMVPCGVCPVYRDCHVGGDISPATCKYMQEWLEF